MQPFPRRHRCPSRRQRMEALMMARPMTSLLEKEILLATDVIRPGLDRWVGALVDAGNFVPAPGGGLVAWRAVDRRGGLFWLVVSRNEAMRYHSAQTSPHAALTEAHAAFACRRRARRDWTRIEALTHDLLRFRRRLTVTRQDAQDAGLSLLAISSFCDRVGLGRRMRIPGWLAAVLMRWEPDIGFALHAAALRQDAASGPV